MFGTAFSSPCSKESLQKVVGPLGMGQPVLPLFRGRRRQDRRAVSNRCAPWQVQRRSPQANARARFVVLASGASPPGREHLVQSPEFCPMIRRAFRSSSFPGVLSTPPPPSSTSVSQRYFPPHP